MHDPAWDSVIGNFSADAIAKELTSNHLSKGYSYYDFSTVIRNYDLFVIPIIQGDAPAFPAATSVLAILVNKAASGSFLSILAAT